MKRNEIGWRASKHKYIWSIYVRSDSKNGVGKFIFSRFPEMGQMATRLVRGIGRDIALYLAGKQFCAFLVLEMKRMGNHWLQE